MAATTPYDTDLPRNAANFQPLTPLSFLARAAAVYPDQTAIVHGARSWTYREFYARARRLASALAKRGIKRGDTVAAVLPNVPAMLEAHYGVAMAGAVLNTINTRLDAAIIALQARSWRSQSAARGPRIFHGREGRAWRAAKRSPLSSTMTIPNITGAGRTARQSRLRGFAARGRSGFRLADAGRRMGRHRAQLHLRHHRRSQGRRLSSPRRLSAWRWRMSSPAAWPSIRSICGRCRCFTATAGVSLGPCRWLRALTFACEQCAPRRSTTPSPRTK